MKRETKLCEVFHNAAPFRVLIENSKTLKRLWVSGGVNRVVKFKAIKGAIILDSSLKRMLEREAVAGYETVEAGSSCAVCGPLVPLGLPLKQPCSLSQSETAISNSKLGMYIYVYIYSSIRSIPPLPPDSLFIIQCNPSTKPSSPPTEL